MKEFNLKRALAGDRVVTRSGKEAKDLAYFESLHSKFKVRCVIEGVLFRFTIKGEVSEGCSHSSDLFMAPIKHTGWVYSASIRSRQKDSHMIKVEWEE